MSRKERRRLEAFSRVKTGGLTLVAAGEMLGLSYRQTKRAWSRYKEQGDAGLVHRLRGRASNRRALDETTQAALSLYREQYGDYGPTLAAECLAKDDGIAVAVTTLRRWLLQAGLWERRRKRPPHRRRRTRRQRRGDLIQMDGSHHDWFEGRRGRAVLMVMIDDATGEVTARFYENESWASSSDLFQRYAKRHGLARILSIQESRAVAKDWTVRWHNRVLQLPSESAAFVQSGQRVTVCEPLDGALRVFVGEREVPWSAVRNPPQPKLRKRLGPTGSSQGRKPAADHPWRKRYATAKRLEPSVP
jgi:hypothetical protein